MTRYLNVKKKFLLICLKRELFEVKILNSLRFV